MDSIPNEILLEIIRRLEKKDIPKMRLVSKRFNLLATTSVRKLCQVRFTTNSEIAKFVAMFENKAVVPFENFGFFEEMLVYGQPLEQFCVLFGKLVKYWQVFGYWETQRLRQNSLSENVQILLENCVNVEEMGYEGDSTGKFTKIPVLRNLKTITIKRFKVESQRFPLLLEHIFEKAPNLRNISIENFVLSSLGPVNVADILYQLHNMNGTVRIEQLCLFLDLPVTNIGDLQKLAAISTQFRVVDFQLYFAVWDRNPDRLHQQMEILSKWIQQVTPARNLFLGSYDMLNPNDLASSSTPITMPLYSLANLQCLNLTNLGVYIPVVPCQHTEFPVLTSLSCSNDGDIIKFSFSGCVFPNVKHAEVCLKTDEECEQWPWVLPNVEKLFVKSKTLKGFFRFPKLRELHVTVVYGVSVDDVRQHWNHLTSGAKYVSDGKIFSFPVNTPKKTSDSIDSFQNLPLLTELSFNGESSECWKGIIYASRTGHLRRLQKITLRLMNLHDFKMREQIRTELMKYHDSVIIE